MTVKHGVKQQENAQTVMVDILLRMEYAQFLKNNNKLQTSFPKIQDALNQMLMEHALSVLTDMS